MGINCDRSLENANTLCKSAQSKPETLRMRRELCKVKAPPVVPDGNENRRRRFFEDYGCFCGGRVFDDVRDGFLCDAIDVDLAVFVEQAINVFNAAGKQN